MTLLLHCKLFFVYPFGFNFFGSSIGLNVCLVEIVFIFIIYMNLHSVTFTKIVNGKERLLFKKMFVQNSSFFMAISCTL